MDKDMLFMEPPRKKTDSTSEGYISVESQPIFKNYMRSGTADFERLCSFIRLKVMIKNMTSVPFRNEK